MGYSEVRTGEEFDYGIEDVRVNHEILQDGILTDIVRDRDETENEFQRQILQEGRMLIHVVVEDGVDDVDQILQLSLGVVESDQQVDQVETVVALTVMERKMGLCKTILKIWGEKEVWCDGTNVVMDEVIHDANCKM